MSVEAPRDPKLRELAAALSAALGGRATVVAHTEGPTETTIEWDFRSREGRPLLGRPPTIHFDGERYSWALGDRRPRFKLDDLRAVDPNQDGLGAVASEPARALAEALSSTVELVEAGALSAALVDRFGLRASFCALAVRLCFPRADFFELRRIGQERWRHRLEVGSAKLEPPFSPEALEVAARAVAGPAVVAVARRLRSLPERPPLFADDRTGVWAMR